MSEKCLLFVYGMLKSNISPPKSVINRWDDSIKGELYDLGDYPGIVKVGKSKSKVKAEVLEIDIGELDALDDYEDVESGEYIRKVTETTKGHTVWVYEYALELPETAVKIDTWDGSTLAPKYN